MDNNIKLLSLFINDNELKSPTDLSKIDTSNLIHHLSEKIKNISIDIGISIDELKIINMTIENNNVIFNVKNGFNNYLLEFVKISQYMKSVKDFLYEIFEEIIRKEKATLYLLKYFPKDIINIIIGYL